MKRAMSFFLSALLILSLAACGGQAGTQSDDPTDYSMIDLPENSLTADGADSPDEVSPSGDPADQTPTSHPSDGSLEQPVPPENTEQGSSQEQPPVLEQNHTVPSGQTPTVSVPEQPAPEQSAPADDSPKVLIAYFTWAENTVVDDPSAVDVDASTSASVVAPGNAARLAAWIQQEVGGDLHSIVVTDLYSSDYDECLDRAADEKAENARPALSTHVSNFADYDVVFLGFPNWWYTLPMPVLSFVEEYDWSGKTVVPFVTHGTGGLASTIRDLTAALPKDTTVLKEISVSRENVSSAQSAVRDWIGGLEF
ncbi:NAD(P)H-dependent oxidoreductase [Oscillibacter sp. MSJ-2]|uniref:NAD(P)H-dependent oxidoreductase n=1 Tax=Dysosmobacter acutus TaxID=2841504 RepID=A0ABS6F752_9FIRM|nr:flavodoxin [Dysosmobacter acutus]MBU5626108.1 NAD(P)H-dependent oxidoreductase [Dysosmobacter acutus]